MHAKTTQILTKDLFFNVFHVLRAHYTHVFYMLNLLGAVTDEDTEM